VTPHERLRELGATLAGRDLAVYEAAGKDPSEPVLGLGPREARVCLFGRDPGKDEIKVGVPFVGAAGKLLRKGLHQALFGRPATTFEERMAVQDYFFWANMVPFKPLGNKAWPVSIVRSFRPPILELLSQSWAGTDVLCLGDGAFKWFGLDDRAVRDAMDAHWARPDRYESHLEVDLGGRRVRLHPLPHPSPLNATWLPKFPGLLDARLRAVGISQDRWRT
jgi:uracil-DNA glycosylase